MKKKTQTTLAQAAGQVQNTYFFALFPSGEDKKRLQFVAAAMSKDEARPALCGMYIDQVHERIVGSDGFRLHMAKMPQCINDVPELHNQVIEFHSPLTSNVIFVSILGSRYPDYGLVLDSTLKHEPIYSYALDNNLYGPSTRALEKALRKNYAYFRTELRGHGEPVIFVPSDVKHPLSDYFAMIMPINSDAYQNTGLGVVEKGLVEARKEAQSLKDRLKRADLMERAKSIRQKAEAAQLSELTEQAAGLMGRLEAIQQEIITLENKINHASK